MERALFAQKDGGTSLRELQVAELPGGDVTVKVEWSSLNYKDALAVTGRSPIIRGEFPFVPGIDLAGRVIASDSDAFPTGTPVIQTGWGLGETRWGGFATVARLRSEHLVRIPGGMSAREAMTAGTAGFTAALAVRVLSRHGVEPASGPVVVTGASGGVGSFAVALLDRAGFEVHAVTGSPGTHDFLKQVGASTLLDRQALGTGPERDLDRGTWAGAVDVAGGKTLAAVLSKIGRHGCVAVCGLAQSPRLETTVFPFILRGVTLAGIDSNTCPTPEREAAWSDLSRAFGPKDWARFAEEIALEDVPEASLRLLDEGVRGRLIVRIS